MLLKIREYFLSFMKIENLMSLTLILSVFFLPFGFDFLFYVTLQITKSYFITDIIFYGISISFFIAHLILKKKSKK